MKNIIFIILINISLAFSVSAKNDGGGSSGGSSDRGGGSYSGSTGYDKELKRILFEIEKNENYQGALKDLEIYVYENPQNANGWNLIGFASRKLGKFDDAELYYNTGLEIEPRHDDILAYQGELYLQTDRYEMALENLAILTDICIFNCSEKIELAEAIKKYELENNL